MEKEQVLYFSFQKCESMDVLYFFIVSFPCYLQYQMVKLKHSKEMIYVIKEVGEGYE